VATADNARGVLALPAGSEVSILQERGDWNYVALPNDQRGWIATSAVEKVRL
jgi:SH3-like domain-containing protein